MPDKMINIGDDVQVGEEVNGDAFIRHLDTGNGATLQPDGTFGVPSLDATDVESPTVNGIEFVEPGNLQSAIDSAQKSLQRDLQEKNVLYLRPNTLYDEGSAVNMRPGVEVDFNGAMLAINSDHPGIVMEGGSAVRNLKAKVFKENFPNGELFTRNVIAVNTDAADADKFADGPNADGTFEIDGYIELPDGEGTGLLLKANGTLANGGPKALSLGNRIKLRINRGEYGAKVEAVNGGYINMDPIELYLNQIKYPIYHEAGGDFQTIINGLVQCSGPTEDVFTSLGENDKGFTFRGFLWDPKNVNGYVWNGSQIGTYLALTTFHVWDSAAPGSSDITVQEFGPNGIRHVDPVSGEQTLVGVSSNGGFRSDSGFFAPVSNGVVYADDEQFASAQAAVDYAMNNDHSVVQLGSKTYDPINITSGGELTIRGKSKNPNSASSTTVESDNGSAIIANAPGITVENLLIRSNDASSSAVFCNDNYFAFRNINIENSGGDGFYISGSRGTISGCSTNPANITGDGVFLTSASNDVTVVGNCRMGTITNNSTSDVVGLNT